MTKRETTIRRIQKLRALADAEQASGNTEAAASAIRIAAKLQLQYAIEAVEIDCPIDRDDEVTTRVAHTGRRLAWLRGLYHAVAKANNCTSSYMPNSDIVTFYGTAADCEIAEYLAVYLAREVQREADAYVKTAKAARKHYEANPWDNAYAPKASRHDFCHNAVWELARRLKAMRREAAEEAKKTHGDAAVGNALVRLDNKLQRAQDFAARFNLRKGRGSRVNHNAAGREAGKRININKGVGGGSSAAGALT